MMISPTMSTDNFVQTGLQSKPGIAVFDCDGTLWSNNSGEDFFYWSMKRGLVSADIEKWARQRYEDYRHGKVGEEAMCGEMTTMYESLRVADLGSAAAECFAAVANAD